MENKDIKGFEGEYQIDTEGKVYSVKFGKRRLLKQCKDKNGYLMVRLSKDGKGKMFKVHRLVAMAFIPNPDNLPIINHKNEIRNDNRVENLEWCTQKYNINYGNCREKMSQSKKGNVFNANGRPPKPVNQFTKEGILFAKYLSIKEAESKGFDHSNVSKCCRGIKKTCGGYIWRYAE